MAELDVELDVLEHPETPNFPRRPNVVSHRTHVLKFNVTVTGVPTNATKWVTIAVSVFSYGPERLGEAAHVSRARKLWGKRSGRVSAIDPAALPARYEIIVNKMPGDDHLGQGPYEAIVTVNSSTQAAQPPDPDPNLPPVGNEFSIEFASM